MVSSIAKGSIKLNKADAAAKSKITNNKICDNATCNKKDQDHGGRVSHNGIALSDESEEESSVEKGELEASSGKAGEKKYEQDVVFIQDVGFTVKIQSPGAETFDLQVKPGKLASFSTAGVENSIL